MADALPIAAPYRYAKLTEKAATDGLVNLADEPRLALLAVCIAEQQHAGFRDHLDLRQAACPDCNSPGFNTGWGYWLFVCGTEILTSGDVDKSCKADGA